MSGGVNGFFWGCGLIAHWLEVGNNELRVITNLHKITKYYINHKFKFAWGEIQM